jgi:hypothetical protein
MSNIKIKIHNFFLGRFSTQFIDTLYRETLDCNTLLDIGCGFNIWMKKLTSHMDHSVGIDSFAPSIDKAKIEKTHHEFIIDEFENAISNIADKSFDTVVALDLIEHLTKEKGFWLISQMERIAVKKILIFTPNGFSPQTPYDNNPYQLHISGWEIPEMKKLKFNKIFGFGGFKQLRGERFSLKYKPRIFWKFIALYSQLITYRNPRLSYSILCIKEFQKSIL